MWWEIHLQHFLDNPIRANKITTARDFFFKKKVRERKIILSNTNWMSSTIRYRLQETDRQTAPSLPPETLRPVQEQCNIAANDSPPISPTQHNTSACQFHLKRELIRGQKETQRQTRDCNQHKLCFIVGLSWSSKIRLNLSTNFNRKRKLCQTEKIKKKKGLQPVQYYTYGLYGLHDPSNIPAFLFQVCINNYITKNSENQKRGFPVTRDFKIT